MGGQGTFAVLPPLEDPRNVFAQYLRISLEDLDGLPIDDDMQDAPIPAPRPHPG